MSGVFRLKNIATQSCFSPQIGFPHVISTSVAAILTSVPKSEASGTPCANCGGQVTPKEVSYCRFNFAKLGRRYLCRKCQ